MPEGYDFDIARVGDRIRYHHDTLVEDGALVGTVTEVKEMWDYDYVVHVEAEEPPDLTVRMYKENIGADYYSVELLDWNVDG